MRLTQLFAAGVAVCVASQLSASTPDRIYELGESESGTPGATVTQTFDDAGTPGEAQLIDLASDPTASAPTYVTIPGRPDGGSGIGVQFSGDDYLRAESLNWPEQTVSSIGGRAVPDGQGGTITKTLNYTGIANRSMQFWVRPGLGGTDPQSVVLDSNQHGVRINEEGNFSLRFGGRDTASDVAATANTWFHVQVVRPNGAAGGSWMYVDGVAVAADAGNYFASSTNLVLGANTAGDDGTDGGEGFTGGTEEFFVGIIDELELSVIGDNSDEVGPPPGMDWGDFNFATDNAFAEFTLSGVAGDVDNSGVFNQADVDDFIAGWQSENVVNGVRVGDLDTLGSGDLNFDGVTDIFDLNIIQGVLRDNGFAAITGAQLAGVAPEPSAVILVFIAAVGLAGRARKRVR